MLVPLGFGTNTKQTAIKPPTSFEDLIQTGDEGEIVIAHSRFVWNLLHLHVQPSSRSRARRPVGST